MQYDGMAWGIGLLALLALWVAARILLKGSWFLGWLRGTLGLLVLTLAGVIVMLALDLGTYSAVPENKLLATIGFEADGAQRYRVNVLQGDSDRTVSLDGDQWQLDVRLFQWKGLAALIGLESGYRLEKITGRYISLEQQQQSLSTRVPLGHSRYAIDMWRWLRMGGTDLYVFDPQARRVNYLPMANGAVFTISLAATGLLVQPLNPAAEQALQNWR